MPGEARSGRESILATADELFYEHGFHAVGVDLIVARAGVAKSTMYRHFPSKDALIVAYLERADERFWAWFEASLDPRATPAQRLAGLFDSLATLATSASCRGCPCQATAAEFPELTAAGHATALVHKEAVRARLCQLAADAGAIEPQALGDALLMLMDGAFAAARMFGSTSPAAGVGAAARSLIDASIPREPRRRGAAAEGHPAPRRRDSRPDLRGLGSSSGTTGTVGGKYVTQVVCHGTSTPRSVPSGAAAVAAECPRSVVTLNA